MRLYHTPARQLQVYQEQARLTREHLQWFRENADLNWYAKAIAHQWQEGVHRFINCGRLLNEAEKQFGDAFWEMVESERVLPIGKRMVQVLQRIADTPWIASAANRDSLPPHVMTLNELAKLKEGSFKRLLKSGKIHPEMERKDARSLVLKIKAQEELAAASKQNVGSAVSLWLVDPPWQVSYNKGLPYKTMSTRDIIEMRLGPKGKATKKPNYPTIKEACAPCAAIGLWAVEELLHDAEEVLEAWDFEMLSPRIIWNKGSHVRPGAAALMQHEYLLIGVRGGARPLWKPKSVVTEPWAGLKNSQKPVAFHAMMKKMFPLLVERWELFARRPVPEGWHGWGNQYPGDVPAKSRRAA